MTLRIFVTPALIFYMTLSSYCFADCLPQKQQELIKVEKCYDQSSSVNQEWIVLVAYLCTSQEICAAEAEAFFTVLDNCKGVDRNSMLNVEFYKPCGDLKVEPKDKNALVKMRKRTLENMGVSPTLKIFGSYITRADKMNFAKKR